MLRPFTLEINIASLKPVTLLAARPLCASLNFYIKAQCASTFHHLFIWANGIVHGDSMIRQSEEMHSALHSHAHAHAHTHTALLALANCIFIKKKKKKKGAGTGPFHHKHSCWLFGERLGPVIDAETLPLSRPLFSPAGG